MYMYVLENMNTHYVVGFDQFHGGYNGLSVPDQQNTQLQSKLQILDVSATSGNSSCFVQAGFF